MDKLDVFGAKPLHHLNRFRLIVELRQTRAELKEARQKIRDLTGALDAIGKEDNEVPSPAHDVRKAARPRI